jgi:uncharacterized membrane protein YbaN (DUF454 family)
MINKELILGIIIGLVSAILGTYLYVKVFTDYNLVRDYKLLHSFDLLSKVITLGTLLSVVSFLFFFYKKRDSIARGIVVSVVLLLILTFFI